MTVRGIIVALSVVAVIGAVAAMAALSLTAEPTAAQEPTPALTPPPPPTATPDPATEQDARRLDEMHEYCHDGEVRELEADIAGTEVVNGVEFKTVSLQWWSKRSYWDLPEGMLAYYRIQTQSHDKDDPTAEEWQTVETVTNTDVWKGVVETGHWHYRVGLIGLTYGDQVHECQTTKWREAEVNVLNLQEELEQICEIIEIIYIYHVAATVAPSPDGQGETVKLEWESELEYYLDYAYHYYGYTQLPEETVGNYRVERILDGSNEDEGNWETVAEVSDTNTWSGPGEPGDWIYRVALVSLQAGDVVGQCEKPLWAQVDVFVPTAEERAKEEADRLVLIEQASACALDALSDNFTPAARSVIGEYIDKRVGEIAEDSEFGSVVTMTVMFCTDREGQLSYYSYQPGRVEYILSVLFDGGYY